jgi:predicted GTPase
MDIVPEAEDNLPKILDFCKKHGLQIFPISAASKQGLDELIKAVHELVNPKTMPLRLSP